MGNALHPVHGLLEPAPNSERSPSDTRPTEPAHTANSPAFPLVRAVLVGATGFEPVTSSVSAKHREPLCETPFSRVTPDRRCPRETLSFRPVKRSLRRPELVGGDANSAEHVLSEKLPSCA